MTVSDTRSTACDARKTREARSHVVVLIKSFLAAILIIEIAIRKTKQKRWKIDAEAHCKPRIKID